MGVRMEAGSIVVIAMIAAGIAVMLCSFWFLSVKKNDRRFCCYLADHRIGIDHNSDKFPVVRME